ncbi:hypothetical protein FBUS_10527 [Fasciolopsis buskii]|uniref:Uncharacterized protein n=1 Tax=Fasciolopsis buskii TaxID=27845 RepID=A0A8E0RX19_9TREM|nr:hypothetical protein FBUS_10527 [Fasciolopsis buski]
MTRLPGRLLRLYLDAYTELWNQNKINPLLTVLNDLSRERGIPAHMIPDTTASQSPQLSENGYRVSSRQQQPYPYSASYDPRSGLPSSFMFNNNSQHQTGEDIILACFTFPASPTSNRLNRLLNELSDIGRVSVETPEEQACDVMRLRFRLFNRRVLTLLEEPKRGPIYLVGFGVGSILVLSSAMHLQPVDVRDDRYNIAGLICLGMPLLGLKGPRGYPNDPLLSIPEIPTLFIVGSASRLGGHKQALYFRRLILHARLKSQLGNTPDGTDASRDSYPEDLTSHVPSSPGSSSLQSRSSNISVLTVGGADCLLRLRLSLCENWCTTQEEVDKRIVDAIRRFILAADHAVLSTYHGPMDITSIDSPPDTPNHYDTCRMHAMQSYTNSSLHLPFRGRTSSTSFGPCISPTHCTEFVPVTVHHRRIHSLTRRMHMSGPSTSELLP